MLGTAGAARCMQVHHPRVEQMVAVAAHSFTAGDLLRMERVLLDALRFSITGPTAYTFLHLLTQARQAPARGAAGSAEAGAAAARQPACVAAWVVLAHASHLSAALHACRPAWRLALRV